MYCNCLISYLCKIIKWTELQTEPFCSPLETSFKVDMGPLINAFCIPSFNQQWCLRNESFQKPTNVNVRDVEVRRLIISSSHRRKLLEEQCSCNTKKEKFLNSDLKCQFSPSKKRWCLKYFVALYTSLSQKIVFLVKRELREKFPRNAVLTGRTKALNALDGRGWDRSLG